MAFVYEAGSNPHKKASNGIVVSDSMKKWLKKHELSIEKGCLSRKIQEIVESKAIACMSYARGFYEDWVNPGLAGSQRSLHENRWVKSVFKGLWSVCSGVNKNGL
jgi:hypothetical protein